MLSGAKLIKWVTEVLIIAIPLAAATYWLLTPSTEIVRSWVDIAAPVIPVGQFNRGLAALACVPAIGLTVTGLSQLRRCASAVAGGQLFGDPVSSSLRRLGWLALFLAPVLVLTSALVTIALTHSQPEGRRWIVISIDTGTPILVVTGVLALLVSRVVAKARELADEHSYLV